MNFWKKRPFHWLTGIALIFAVLVGTFSLSQNLVKAKADSGPVTWQLKVGAETPKQYAEGMAFLPSEVWVNVGDTIVWTSQSLDFHTVTFLQPGQPRPIWNFADPTQNQRLGSSHYDGVGYYNSGVLENPPSDPNSRPPGVVLYTNYQLTFDTPGDFTYICIVHDGMQGIVHVRPAGTPYPYTQQDYNNQIATQQAKLLADAYSLYKRANASTSSLHVADGYGDSQVDLMRFYPNNITVHVGDTITFTNDSPMEAHTVTFGEPPTPDFLPYGNPLLFDGTQPINSGTLNPGQSYQVTFTKAGSFAFRCDFHDFMNMTTTITVQ